ncbi:MAG: ATP-binding protein [Rhodobacteraceae bacterium]|nr:ATP-binding protein [Paracoccaceae bacterium]
MRLIPYISLYLAFAAGLVFAVWQLSYREALRQHSLSAQASLSLAADRLTGRLERYRMLPVILVKDGAFLAALEGSTPTRINPRLRQLADMTGSLNISLVDAAGKVVADSAFDTAQSYLGRSLEGRPDFVRAMNGALGFYHLQERIDTPRGFTFASPVRDTQSRIVGALVVKADLENLELHWRGDPETVFFVDENNVVFISNRSELLLRYLGAPVPAASAVRYGNMRLEALPDPQETNQFGYRIWNGGKGRNLPAKALLETQPLPVIGMDAYILTDIRPAIEAAQLRAGLVAALLGLFGALLWGLYLRRSALARQLVLRQEANAQLEARVEKRTAQLRRAQDDLVQAGKLSALGQMAAGISHELNQPLAAIRSFSENAQVFLARGQVEKADKNLGRIADLTNRMARIIKNLRAFSRKEGEGVGDVALGRAVEDAIEIAAARLRSEGVTLGWQRPKTEIIAKGGAIRLQQVVLNLISNAVDAMAESTQKRINITISDSPESARIVLRDSGPGLEAPEKIFEPFYTTKTPNKADGIDDGMGLGLSISYGIVQSFGGDIKGENHPDGGAVFTVALPKGAQK